MRINDDLMGYRVISAPSNANAGTSEWARAMRDGHEYFIKRLLAPTYPTDDGPGSPTAKERRRQRCDRFVSSQRELLERFRGFAAGGAHVLVPLDFFRVGSHFYKVTDFIEPDEAIDLATCDAADAATAIRSLLVGLRAMHQAGVVHGDLKLENVLFKRTASGALISELIDLDSAFLAGSQPDPTQLATDGPYCSPELVAMLRDGDGVSVGLSSDIYSLGVLLHLLCTGVFPLRTDGAMVPLADLQPTEARMLLAAMLNDDHRLRPTIEEVVTTLDLATLRQLLQSREDRRPVPAPEPTTPERQPDVGGTLSTQAEAPSSRGGGRLRSTFGHPETSDPTATDHRGT